MLERLLRFLLEVFPELGERFGCTFDVRHHARLLGLLTSFLLFLLVLLSLLPLRLFAHWPVSDFYDITLCVIQCIFKF